MDLYESILEALKQQYDDGATYQEMADKFGASYTHIYNLLKGNRPISGISLDLFFKIFPKASVSLNGDAAAVHASGTNGNVVGVNNGTIGADCISAAIDKILDSDELSDAEKIKVMKVLKK